MAVEAEGRRGACCGRGAVSAARARPASGVRGGRGGGRRVGGGGGRGRPGRNSRLGGSLGPSGLLHLLGAVVNHQEPLVGARCRIALQRGRGVERLDGTSLMKDLRSPG
jgi:hypothetical protein